MELEERLMNMDDLELTVSTEMEEVDENQKTKGYGYDFWDYQKDSATTATYPSRGDSLGLAYITAGLASEAGEVAGKIAKGIRDANGHFDEERVNAIRKELGDVLWFVSELCTHFGIQMGDAAIENVEKLKSRMERGVLGGSGDNR